MIFAILLLVVGIFLSAFFSGSETRVFRVTRVRLMLDALGGDWIARGLLWLTNHPSLFVATTLVGNNMANYLVSLAAVMGIQLTFAGTSHWPELLAPLVLAPLVFIYGELLPKNLFYQAPNRMLRKCGPAFLFCTVLLLPISGLMWGLSKILQWIAGSSSEPLQMVLARHELEQVLKEGHEVGILRPTQRGLAQGLFAVANRPVREFATPPGRIPRAQPSMNKAEVLRLARRHRLTTVPIEDPHAKRKLIGYLRVIDLYLSDSNQLPPPRPLVDVPETDTYIAALMRLQRSAEILGEVVSAQGQTVGFITARQLSDPLFRAS